MKKKIYTMLIALLAIAINVQAQVVLNEENFPDANFRAALATKLGISEGETITQEEINTTTFLDVSVENISNLKGIEHFTALTELYCMNNQLTALDVSNNTALTYLNCNDNQLTTLDVSNNTALEQLDCSYNQLIALDVSNNTALTTLYCYYNQLTTLDVSKNTALAWLWCNSNQLTDLNVSKNTALTYLNCSVNQIKGAAMDALVASLPTVTSGSFYVIDTQSENEGNVCTKTQINTAKAKGWKVNDE